MDRTTELALASTYVYNRNRVNRVGIPPGWQIAELANGQPAYLPDNGVSFSAGAFIDDEGGLVFSFTGTNGGMDWVTGNLPSGLALPAPQIFEALRFVSDVLARYAGEVEPRTITFTGHSLGGGLASVMAVFFGSDAHLFDPAPFQLSATMPDAVLKYFAFYSTYQTLLNRPVNADFAAYAANPLGLFDERQANVLATAVSGEILYLLRADATNIYSSIDRIDVTSSTLYQTASSVPAEFLLSQLPFDSPIDVALGAYDAFNAATELHSIDLLTLMSGSSFFKNAIQQSPRLIELMFANDLYGPGASSAEVDFTARLMQYQFGVPSDLIGADPKSATPLADRFGEDILRLGTLNAQVSSPISEGMIAALIQAYRFSTTAPVAGYVDSTGTAAHIDLMALPTGETNFGVSRLIQAAAQSAAPEDIDRVQLAAASARHWFVQNTSAALSSAGTSDNDTLINLSGNATSLDGGAANDLIMDGTGHSVMHGGTGSDTLIGGAGDDFLDGGAEADYLSGGADVDSLYGGTGDDLLYGGAGDDEYYFTSGDGSDIVVDSDGAGKIFIDGVQLAVGQRIAQNAWLSADGGLTIQRIPYGGHQAPSLFDLVIHSNSSDLTITIQRWQMDQLNIDLTFGAVPAPGDNANDVVPIAPVAAFSSFRQFALGDFGRGDFRRWDARWRFGVAPDRVAAITANWSPGSYSSGTGTVSSYQDLDNLRGSTGSDRMFGLAGNDSLVAGDGDDYLDGGADRDVLIGGLGSDHIIGGDGSDVISGDLDDAVFGTALGDQEGDTYLPPLGLNWITQFSGLGWGVERSPTATIDTMDLLWGGSSIYSGGSGDVIDAGAGDDRVWADDGDDVISGDDGDDQIWGGAGNDLIFGGAGADRLFGDAQHQVDPEVMGYSPITAQGADEIHGGDGDDQIDGYGGSDALFGDDGADEIYGDGAAGVVAAAEQGDDLLDGGAGNDVLLGGGGHDTLLGGGDNDELHGDGQNAAGAADGNDLLDGGAGNDELYGNGGDDRLIGGAGIDIMFGDAPGLTPALQGDDHLDGGADNDIMSGGGGRDTLLGGDGADQMHGDQRSAGLAGSAQNDDYLDGGVGDDSLTGGGGADTLMGGDGVDVIRGDDQAGSTAGEFHGGDIIDAGFGNDTVYGDGAADVIHGGDGNDVLRGDANDLAAAFHGDDYISGDTGDDVIAGDGGNDQLYGGAGDDQIQGDSVANPALTGDDYIDGGAGNDVLFGQGGNDVIVGSLGNDQIAGNDGNDQLAGGEGNDTIYGDAGNDTLTGGAGSDYLEGGAGDDLYVFNQEDLRITENTTDNIVDLQGENRIVFRDGVTQQNMTLAAGVFSGSVVIMSGEGVYGLTVDNALSGSVREYTFADGSSAAAHRLIGASYTGAANQTSSAANSYLLGGTRNDTISGTGNAATISGGRGNDTLTGGTSARTTYLFERGDGADTLNDQGGVIVGGQLMTNTLSFGAGIDVSSLQLECTQAGLLSIRVRGTTDAVTLQRFSQSNVLGANLTLDEFRFSDGSTLTWQQLITQLGIDVVNTGFVWTAFSGTNVNDRIHGGGGNETISGEAGDDIIYGNGGQDTLDGGLGNDTYVYGRGHGSDVINNTDEAGTIDKLRFDSTLIATELTWYRYDDHLIGRISGSTEFIRVNNFFTGALDLIEFADGTTLTAGTVSIASPQAQATTGTDLIYGSQLGDVIDALAGDDIVHGGAGNDALYGSDGSDTLNGEAGNDTLDGNSGADTLFGGDGNDTINDSVGSNFMNGNAGDDVMFGTGTVYGGIGNDTITGGAGSAIVYGQDGDDTLTGGTSTSSLSGDAGNDTLIAGAGASTMRGGAGNDTYIYNIGSGTDTVEQDDAAAGSMDVLLLGAGISPQDVVLEGASDGTLLIRFRTASGTLDPNNILKVYQALGTDATRKLDRIEFESDPGVTWAWSQIEQMAFTPTDHDNYIPGSQTADVIDALDGNDTVYGLGGDDTINGGAGFDYLYGGDGSDTLHSGIGGAQLFGEAGDDTLIATTGGGLLSGGQGNDTYLVERATSLTSITISNSDSATADVLKLGAGISLSDTRYRRSGNNLVIRVYGSGGQPQLNEITISNYFTSIGSVIDQIRFVDEPGTALNYADALALTFIGDSSNETITGTSAGEIMRGNGGNDVLNALDGNDDLDGGSGYDRLNGGTGNDIYRFAAGSAEDMILDTGGANDRIEFASGIAPSQVSLYRFGAAGGDSLALVLNNGNEQLLVTNHFAAGDASRVEEIRFGNGAVWDAAYILANVTDLAGPADTQSGTGANDTFTVNHASDIIVEASGGGMDTVNAYVYEYTLGANVENLNLLGPLNSRANGNSLNNVLNGNAADNVLYGADGVDTMSGGAGNDTYYVDQIYASTWSTLRHNNFQDIVIEAAGGGIDTIYATTYSAIMPANVERLILETMVAQPNSGPVGTDFRRKFIGNELDNYIDLSGPSTSADFLIDGGLGADTMIGRGDDTYVVDNAGDLVIDAGGFDVVESWINYTLVADVEELKLLGTADLDGTGNATSNELNGNSGDNVLSGLDGYDVLRGGAGNDTLIGGNGSDSYVFTPQDGLDVINASSTDATKDDLQFTVADSSDFTFSRIDDDLVISDNDSPTTNAVRVSNWFVGEQWQLESVSFYSGSGGVFENFTTEDINAMFEPTLLSAGPEPSWTVDEAALGARRLMDAMNHFGGDRHLLVDPDPHGRNHDFSALLYAGIGERSRFENIRSR